MIALKKSMIRMNGGEWKKFCFCETETVFCSDIKPKLFSTEVNFLPNITL